MFGWLKKKKKKSSGIIIEMSQCTCNPEPILLHTILDKHMDKISGRIHELQSQNRGDEAYCYLENLVSDDDVFNPEHVAAVLLKQIILNSIEDEKKSAKKEEVKKPAPTKKKSAPKKKSTCNTTKR